MQKNGKIFVAGGTGLVGSALIKKLIEKGYKNIIASYHNRIPTTNNQYTNIPITWSQLNLANQQAVDDFFRKHNPEYVFLAAAKVGGIIANSTYKADFIYQNIMIAANVIHAAYKYKTKKLLNLGSSCIYPKYAKQPMKEEYLLTGSLESTNEPYAIAKISAIKLCRYFNEQYGTNFMSVMPTNLYGPNDNFDLKTSHVMPAVLRKMHLAKCLGDENWEMIRKDLNKNPIEGFDGKAAEKNILEVLEKYGIKRSDQLSANSDQIIERGSRLTANPSFVSIAFWGSGSPHREFLHSSDMADACIFLMNNYNASDIGEFVNIGMGKDLKIKELVELIKDIVGFRGTIDWDSSKPDGTPRKLLDVSRMNKLGWSYRIELADGIKSYYEWYLNNIEIEV
jgi:GDP-L-fucose synthase